MNKTKYFDNKLIKCVEDGHQTPLGTAMPHNEVSEHILKHFWRDFSDCIGYATFQFLD